MNLPVRVWIASACVMTLARIDTARAQVYCGMPFQAELFLTISPYHITRMSLVRVFPRIENAEGGTDLHQLGLRGPVQSVESRLVFRGEPDDKAHVMVQEFDVEGNFERTVFVMLAHELDFEGEKQRVNRHEEIVEFRGVYEDAPKGRRLRDRTIMLSTGKRPGEQGKQTFTYDEMGRLVELNSKECAPSSGCVKQTWTYDDAGRLIRCALITCGAPERAETQEYRFSLVGICEAYCITRPNQQPACMNFEQTGPGTQRVSWFGGGMEALSLVLDERGSLAEWDSSDDGGRHRMKQSIVYDEHENWTRLEAQARYEKGPRQEWLPARRVERTIKYREPIKGE